MESIELPKENKINRMVDRESAIRILEGRDIKKPSEAVDNYISQIPDLIVWFKSEGRDYQWRDERDPWKIILVEILLQRTRADAVSEIYNEFTETYSTPESLYQTDIEEIKGEIESLGFVNRRSKCLKSISELIVNEHQGKVPKDIEEMKNAWRVGEYVSRAVQIFARGKPMALVDSNIARVIGRFFDLKMPSQPHKDEEIYELVDSITPKDPEIARLYYFALIDLGALVCTPKKPDHEECPFKHNCRYYNR